MFADGPDAGVTAAEELFGDDGFEVTFAGEFEVALGDGLEAEFVTELAGVEVAGAVPE